MPLEVEGTLRHQHRRGTHGQTYVQRQIAGPVAHDLHHGTALVGLHGIPQLVDALHRRVGGGIESDGVVRTDNIVVDRAGDAHHGNAEFGQILRTAERAVAADGHQAVQPQQLTGGVGLLLALLGAELVAAGAVEDRAAPVDDPADAGVVHLQNVAGDQALIAAADSHALDAPGQRTADHGADTGVHARRVAAAGQYADTFHCIFHIPRPHFITGSFPFGFLLLLLYHNASHYGTIRRLFRLPASCGREKR